MTIIIAQYEGDELINIAYDSYEVNGSMEISAETELKKVSGTKLSIFVWDSISNPHPVTKPIVHNLSK